MRNTHAHNASRRGFSLMEIAIVLGVISLLLGAIWATAGAVHEKASINRAGEELGLIATNIQSMYGSQNVTYSGLITYNAGHINATPTAADFAYYMGIYVPATTGNIFPDEMVSGGAVSNPWSGTVQAALAGSAGNPVQYVIEYQNLPVDACTALIANNSMPGRETRLMQIIISNGGGALGTYNGTGLPVSVSTLGGVCTPANAPFTIDWYYKLGQGCAAGSPC